MYKKIIYIFILAVFALGFSVSTVYANTPATTPPATTKKPDINSLTKKVANESGFETAGVTDTTISETVGGLIRVILSMAGIVFLGLTVYAGILWMTAGGNDERVEKATNIFTRSTVGLILVVSSYSLAYFAMQFILNTNTQETVGGATQSSGWGNDFAEGFLGGASKWWNAK